MAEYALSDLENSPHRFRALFLFKNRPLLDAFDKECRADIFHRNAGAAFGGDPVLNVGQQRAFDAGRDQQFFVADFACGGDDEFGGGHRGFRFFLKGTGGVQRGHSTHSLRGWLTLLASAPASALQPSPWYFEIHGLFDCFPHSCYQRSPIVTAPLKGIAKRH